MFTCPNPNLRASQNLSELTSWENASTITEKVTCTLPELVNVMNNRSTNPVQNILN